METPKLYNSTINQQCLGPYGPHWAQPTAEDVRAIISAAGLTGSKAAHLVGVSSSRTVRKWTGGERLIPYAAWAILCEAAGFGMIWKLAQDTENKSVEHSPAYKS